MPLTKTKRKLFFWIIADSIMIFCIIFFIWHINFINDDSEKKAISLRNEIKKNEMSLILRRESDFNKADAEKIKSYIIKFDEVVDFVNKLEETAVSYGLKTETKSVSYSPMSATTSKRFEELKISINVSGKWDKVQLYLNYLENKIHGISLSKAVFEKISGNNPKDTTLPEWVGSFEFNVIKYKEINE